MTVENQSNPKDNAKTKPRKHVYQNGTQNNANGLTSKNDLSNSRSFGDSEISNGLMTSKRIKKWSCILI